MHEPVKTNADLLERLRAEPVDATAWEDFVRVYGRPVYRWCRDLGLQQADAADVAQDVLVRFWRQASRFRYDPRSTFRGYLRTIVRGAVAEWYAEHCRRHPNGVRRLPADHLARIPSRDDLAARLEKAYDTELLTLAMSDVRARILPHTWRAFHRQVIDQRPGVDVATELGLDVNLVYAARHNVTRMIRETVRRLESADRSDDSE